MPFAAGYSDFEECVAGNQDKKNPRAFCRYLQSEHKGGWPSYGRTAARATARRSFRQRTQVRDRKLPDTARLEWERVHRLAHRVTQDKEVAKEVADRIVRLTWTDGKDGAGLRSRRGVLWKANRLIATWPDWAGTKGGCEALLGKSGRRGAMGICDWLAGDYQHYVPTDREVDAALVAATAEIVRRERTDGGAPTVAKSVVHTWEVFVGGVDKISNPAKATVELPEYPSDQQVRRALESIDFEVPDDAEIQNDLNEEGGYIWIDAPPEMANTHDPETEWHNLYRLRRSGRVSDLFTNLEKAATSKWRVISLDVWGNAKDGFDVNDLRRTGTVVEFPDDATDEQILELLIEEGVLKPPAKQFAFDHGGVDGDTIYIESAKDGEPIINLEREEEGEPPSLFDALEKDHGAFEEGDRVVLRQDAELESWLDLEALVKLKAGAAGIVTQETLDKNLVAVYFDGSSDEVSGENGFSDHLAMLEASVWVPVEYLEREGTTLFDRLEKSTFKVGDRVELLHDLDGMMTQPKAVHWGGVDMVDLNKGDVGTVIEADRRGAVGGIDVVVHFERENEDVLIPDADENLEVLPPGTMFETLEKVAKASGFSLILGQHGFQWTIDWARGGMDEGLADDEEVIYAAFFNVGIPDDVTIEAFSLARRHKGKRIHGAKTDNAWRIVWPGGEAPTLFDTLEKDESEPPKPAKILMALYSDFENGYVWGPDVGSMDVTGDWDWALQHAQSDYGVEERAAERLLHAASSDPDGVYVIDANFDLWQEGHADGESSYALIQRRSPGPPLFDILEKALPDPGAGASVQWFVVREDRDIAVGERPDELEWTIRMPALPTAKQVLAALAEARVPLDGTELVDLEQAADGLIVIAWGTGDSIFGFAGETRYEIQRDPSIGGGDIHAKMPASPGPQIQGITDDDLEFAHAQRIPKAKGAAYDENQIIVWAYLTPEGIVRLDNRPLRRPVDIEYDSAGALRPDSRAWRRTGESVSEYNARDTQGIWERLKTEEAFHPAFRADASRRITREVAHRFVNEMLSRPRGSIIALGRIDAPTGPRYALYLDRQVVGLVDPLPDAATVEKASTFQEGDRVRLKADTMLTEQTGRQRHALKGGTSGVIEGYVGGENEWWAVRFESEDPGVYYAREAVLEKDDPGAALFDRLEKSSVRKAAWEERDQIVVEVGQGLEAPGQRNEREIIPGEVIEVSTADTQCPGNVPIAYLFRKGTASEWTIPRAIMWVRERGSVMKGEPRPPRLRANSSWVRAAVRTLTTPVEAEALFEVTAKEAGWMGPVKKARCLEYWGAIATVAKAEGAALEAGWLRPARKAGTSILSKGFADRIRGAVRTLCHQIAFAQAESAPAVEAELVQIEERANAAADHLGDVRVDTFVSQGTANAIKEMQRVVLDLAKLTTRTERVDRFIETTRAMIDLAKHLGALRAAADGAQVSQSVPELMDYLNEDLTAVRQIIVALRSCMRGQGRITVAREKAGTSRFETSPAHRRLGKRDLCDDLAEQNDFGLGRGVYPDGQFPKIPVHDHCQCERAQVSSKSAARREWKVGERVTIDPEAIVYPEHFDMDHATRDEWIDGGEYPPEGVGTIRSGKEWYGFLLVDFEDGSVFAEDTDLRPAPGALFDTLEKADSKFRIGYRVRLKDDSSLIHSSGDFRRDIKGGSVGEIVGDVGGGSEWWAVQFETLAPEIYYAREEQLEIDGSGLAMFDRLEKSRARKDDLFDFSGGGGALPDEAPTGKFKVGDRVEATDDLSFFDPDFELSAGDEGEVIAIDSDGDPIVRFDDIDYTDDDGNDDPKDGTMVYGESLKKLRNLGRKGLRKGVDGWGGLRERIASVRDAFRKMMVRREISPEVAKRADRLAGDADAAAYRAREIFPDGGAAALAAENFLAMAIEGVSAAGGVLPAGVAKSTEAPSDRFVQVCEGGTCRKERFVPFRKIDYEKQVVLGEVYVPWEVDSQGDWMTPQDIEEMAYWWMENYQLIGKNHVFVSDKDIGVVVESFITRTGDPDFTVPGSWVLGTKVTNPEVWAEVKAGRITGYSIGGEGVREPAVLPKEHAMV